MAKQKKKQVKKKRHLFWNKDVISYIITNIVLLSLCVWLWKTHHYFFAILTTGFEIFLLSIMFYGTKIKEYYLNVLLEKQMKE